ncbi:hypothetical protein [Actinomadura rugatobispora]|uniref:DUF2569 domain-containing protein n=1 Tax=Actinomadura rugatobispora TaxID=1994 RepID=A0ABW0ZPN5_9ACTN|nr:hypothetical protein GCM10010200_027350 [Actinomadura rugatobispora]
MTTESESKSVETSFKLWIAGIVVGLIGALVSLMFMDTLVDNALREDGLTAEDRDLVQGALIGGLFLGSMLLALWFWFVSKMRKGKNWARITLAVLAVLGLVIRLGDLGTYFSGGDFGIMMGLLQLISWCLTIPAVVFMFLPDANEFFARQK